MLFAFTTADTVTPNFFAIPQSVSPRFTVYLMASGDFVGVTSFAPFKNTDEVNLSRSTLP